MDQDRALEELLREGVRARTIRRITSDAPGAAATARGVYRREVVERLPTRREFSARFLDSLVDERGRIYVTPEPNDPLLKTMNRFGDVNIVQKEMVGEAVHLDIPRRTLFYIKMPKRQREGERGNKLPYAEAERQHGVPIPRIGEELQMLSNSDQTLYTGRIQSVHFKLRRRIGYVVVDALTSYGKISDPGQFGIDAR